MNKLPFYGQVLVFFGLGIAIIVAAWMMVLSDMKKEITRYEDEYVQKEQKMRKGQAAEQRLPELEREIETLQAKLKDVQRILPTGQETGELLAWIKNLGDQSNLDLKSFNPRGLNPVEFYKEFPIDMNVVGKYHDLGIFLDKVSKYERIINVDKLKINQAKGQGDKTIRATFTATTFVYDEGAAGGEEG